MNVKTVGDLKKELEGLDDTLVVVNDGEHLHFVPSIYAPDKN